MKKINTNSVRITDRQQESSLRTYLNEIERLRKKDADESRLYRRISKNDSWAREQLVTMNLLFVVSVAKQYEGEGLPLSELISEGNVGLVEASKRFDPSRGFKFISDQGDAPTGGSGGVGNRGH